MRGQIRKIVFKLTIKTLFLQKITQRMTLGIDVGGTNLVVGLVQDGKIVKRVSAPWFPHEATLQETIDTLSERILISALFLLLKRTWKTTALQPISLI